MSTICYNLISFLGNAKVKTQVINWAISLETLTSNGADSDDTQIIKRLFYPDVTDTESIDIGCRKIKWDTLSLTPEPDELSLQTSWNRPKFLEERMACLLYKFDKNVVVRNLFNLDDGTWGVAYTAAENSTAAYSQSTSVEHEDDSDDMEHKLAEAERELLCDYFLDDMPHLTKVIRRHLKHIEVD